MSGDTEVDDGEVSEGASENDYSEHEQEPDVVGKEEDDNTDMAEQKFRSDGDENGKAGSTTKPKLDPKDPLRPRRKKARRACFACQRAHLTCGMFGFCSDEELSGYVWLCLAMSGSSCSCPFDNG